MRHHHTQAGGEGGAHRGADGPHRHSHGLIDRRILRSRRGVRTVALSLAVLGATGVIQLVIFWASGSVALLADLVHNFGDALTAVPLGIAFVRRSARGERWAGMVIVAVILVSAIAAGAEAISRLITPEHPTHLVAVAAAGLAGVAGNEIAARVRLRGGRAIGSAALIADGRHARVDAIASAGVVVSAIAVALGLTAADPLIGLAITVMLLKISWDAWRVIAAAGREVEDGA